jgi:capsular polysaccharide biosynthesis protein
MNDVFDNQRILEVIRKHFLHFVLIGIAAVVLAAFFSSPMFITPKFRSTARIYPVNIAVVSMESESEQMLEIINSNDIKLKMFDAFRLDTVYKIDKQDPQYLTYMLAEYNAHVSTNKTEFETVEISVLDKDPQRAAAMCDSIIHFYNNKVREMHTIKNWEMVTILKNNMDKRTSERDSIHQLIREQRQKYKILDFPTQVREVTRGYMEALSTGRDRTPGGQEIRQLYGNLSEKGGEAYLLETQFRRISNTIDSLKFLYDINLSEATKEITYCFVVEKPFPADKKAYPVRWMIVAMTTLSALFLGLLLFIILDYRRTR